MRGGYRPRAKSESLFSVRLSLDFLWLWTNSFTIVSL